ncbi:NAD(P)/FAD-dependent oxidoreductase [Microbacterium sediminicola]|uniref:NAD(P)/FAD-dependent oxidoreductase n=2 Tax=Microbacterium sediminicola TaxID=415210 RepID=A0ABN2HYJ7_9MICO
MHGVLGWEGVAPEELRARGRAEVAAYGVELLDDTVNSVSSQEFGIEVNTEGAVTAQARAVIVATGLVDELPDLPGLASRWGKTVLHCPYCHGWEVRDARLGVLATSPMSVHQVELVRQWSDRVIFFAAAAGELDDEVISRLGARGVEIVSERVREIRGTGNSIEEVVLEGGANRAVDALFTVGTARPGDGVLSALTLDRTDTPVGSFLAVDTTGRTSNPRVWAAGNVVNPAANVPMSIGAGAMTGGMVNAALVAEEAVAAVRGVASS